MAFAFKRSITISHLKVGTVNNTDQTNFPVLFGGSAGPYAYLASTGFGGAIQNFATFNGQTVPTDLIFTSDSAGLNLLKWEVASYNSNTGDIEVWIQIPTLSHSNDTVIYMLYGDLSTVAYQGGSVGAAWDSNFNAVQHFANGTTLALSDSTSNAVNATNNGSTATTGQIDGGVAANGIVTMPDSALTRPAAATFSFWFNYNTATVNFNRIMQKGSSGSAPFFSYAIFFNGSDQTNIAAGFGFTDNTSDTWASGTGAFSVNTWYKLDAAYDGANVTVYKNGSQVYNHANTRTIKYDTVVVGLGGTPDGGAGNFAGSYDEFRLSKTARSADWLITEYNSEFSPSTFYTVSAPIVTVAQVSRRTFGFPGTRVGTRLMR